MSTLTLVTAPTKEPVTLGEAKAHLRVDGSADDALITGYIVAARQHAEVFTNRAFINTVYELKYPAFPSCFDDILPCPLVSVTSITYVDGAGNSQTLATSQYTVDAPAGPNASPGRVVPAYEVSWPSTRSQINAVTLRFVAGYGTTEASVPQGIRDGIKEYVALKYDKRGGTLTRDEMSAVNAWLWPFRELRF